MTNQPLISIVIVTWNNEKDIEACIKSIYRQDYSNFNLIVVDNNSNDRTVSLIQAKFPKVIILQSSINLYLTGGNNMGIKYAFKNFNPEFIMVLNPDTKSSPNLITKLLSNMINDSKIGAVGPKILFWNNKNEGLLNSAGLFYDGFMQAYDIGFMRKDSNEFNMAKNLFGVSGACILYRSKMLREIGLYWDRIKMYMDEVEMFIRADKKGWIVKYEPGTILYHNYMQSTSKNKSFNRMAQVKKSWLFIALKHYPLKSKIAMVRKFLS